MLKTMLSLQVAIRVRNVIYKMPSAECLQGKSLSDCSPWRWKCNYYNWLSNEKKGHRGCTRHWEITDFLALVLLWLSVNISVQEKSHPASSLERRVAVSDKRDRKTELRASTHHLRSPTSFPSSCKWEIIAPATSWGHLKFRVSVHTTEDL